MSRNEATLSIRKCRKKALAVINHAAGASFCFIQQEVIQTCCGCDSVSAFKVLGELFLALLGIHHIISVGDEIEDVLAFDRLCDNIAGAGAEGERINSACIYRSDVMLNSLGQPSGIGIAVICRENNELVASETSDDVAITEGFLQD